MAFTIDPAQLLATARMQEAKSKAQAAANTFSDGPRYDAGALWADTSASRSSGRAAAYTSGAPAIGNLVPSNLALPQGNSAQKSALYTQAGSDALKGMMGTGLSSMPQNFATLKGIADQGIDSALARKHQDDMNEIEIAKSKIGGGSPVGAILGGIGSIASFGAGQGWFGGGSTPTAPVSPTAPGGDVWGAAGRLFG